MPFIYKLLIVIETDVNGGSDKSARDFPGIMYFSRMNQGIFRLDGGYRNDYRILGQVCAFLFTLKRDTCISTMSLSLGNS